MDDDLTDETLAASLVHGLQPTRVAIAEYDPRWPDRADAHAAALRHALGHRLRLVEHIGSTSVPGLAAKPIIDLVIGIDDPDDEAAYLADLQQAGYELRVREPQHRCLRGGEPNEPSNVHCYPPGHAEIRKYLLLRDHLRSNRADRELYERAKRELATRPWRDVNYYAEAKGPVIREILARAGWRDPDPGEA